jgi:predicted nucleotidyltransferase
MAVPEQHRVFLNNAVGCLKTDERLLGVAVGGSWNTGEMDRFSDLDLVIAVVDDAFDAVMRERPRIAQRLGDYLAGFTGEHVGEPRLFICLYGPPLLHVDLKFVRISDFHIREADPELIWDRSGAMADTLERAQAHWPPANLQWIEDRFWIWIHYGACKIGRGELFEAIDFVSFLRTTVLGPLALTAHGHLPRGVRKLETNVPELLGPFVATLATHDARSCAAALEQAANLYRLLRDDLADESLERRLDAELGALAFLDDIRTDVTKACLTPRL